MSLDNISAEENQDPDGQIGTLDSYRLIDLTGREVLSGANTDRALLSELQSGLYLLEMNASGQTEVQRLFVR